MAFFMVFLLHTVLLPDAGHNSLHALLSVGHLGVDLFFCLSGFLITRILIAAKDGKSYFKNFYMRRALRIFPLYYTFLILYYLLVVEFHLIHFGVDKANSAAADLRWIWLYGTPIRIAMLGHFMTASINHFWTLAIEEHFYFVWPLLVYLLTPRQLIRSAAVITGAPILLRLFLYLKGTPGQVITSFTLCRIDSFAIAGAAGAAHMIPQWRPYCTKFAHQFVAPAILVALCSYWTGGLWYSTAGMSLVAIAFSMLIVTATAQNKVTALLSHPFFTTMGRYSYALYVFHWPIQIALHRRLPIDQLGARLHSLTLAIAANMLAVGLLSSAAAYLSWNLIEKRFLSLKRHFPEHAVDDGSLVLPPTAVVAMNRAA